MRQLQTGQERSPAGQAPLRDCRCDRRTTDIRPHGSCSAHKLLAGVARAAVAEELLGFASLVACLPLGGRPNPGINNHGYPAGRVCGEGLLPAG